MSRRSRKGAAHQPTVNGLQAKITENDSGSPKGFTLECPVCGEVGRYRFELLAQRAFEEHADENHPVAESPLDQIRGFVDLAETAPDTWECTIGAETYVVRQNSSAQYVVEVTSQGLAIDARLTTLDDSRITIGGHAKVVSATLATAATIQLRHPTPPNSAALS
ncbi:hypothetical protein ACIBBE_24270 [Streptomyces sp. NPDC051644]|uniref:hypothetical protein n=1 Tax=Streptomyces sp. NPDC051644 TaxID=3365666 RepID=UPI00378A1438